MDRRDLATTLSRMETKLDTIIETASDHEQRLRSLERSKQIFYGVGLVLGAAISWVLSHLHLAPNKD